MHLPSSTPLISIHYPPPPLFFLFFFFPVIPRIILVGLKSKGSLLHSFHSIHRDTPLFLPLFQESKRFPLRKIKLVNSRFSIEFLFLSIILSHRLSLRSNETLPLNDAFLLAQVKFSYDKVENMEERERERGDLETIRDSS